MTTTVKVAVRATVETVEGIDQMLQALCGWGFEDTVIQGGDGRYYLPFENEYGDQWGIRPCDEDEYDRDKGGHQSVTIALEDIPLPWHVTTTLPHIREGLI